MHYKYKIIMKVILKILFLDYEESLKSSFIIFKEKREIKNENFKINLSKYFNGLDDDYIITPFKITPNDNEIYEANVTIYNGYNIMYCYLKNNYKKNTYEFVFLNFSDKEKVSKIKIGEDELIRGDRFDDTTKMVRFTLINSKYNEINLLNNKINLDDYTKKLKGNSFQISFFSIEKKEIIIKEIEIEDKESIMNIIKNKESIFNSIYELSQQLLREKEIDQNKMKKIRNYKKKENDNQINAANSSFDLLYRNSLSEIVLNENLFKQKINDIIKKIKDEDDKFDKKGLIKMGKDLYFSKVAFKILKCSINESNQNLEKQIFTIEDLELFYKYLIWHFYYCKIKLSNEDINFFIEFLEIMNKTKEEIFKDNNLKNYQKASLIKFYCQGLESNFLDMNKYINTIKGYFFFKDMEENSILRQALEIIKYIGNNINEKSELFFPLLLINSGIGYYNGEKTYCFSILSPKMIRKHINEMIPELIVLYSDNDLCYSVTEKSHKIMKINIKTTYPNLNEDKFQLLFFDLNEISPILDVKSLSMTVIVFLRELLGHNKLTYNKNNSFMVSPKKFFNKENKNIKMIEFDSNEIREDFYKCLSYSQRDGNREEEEQFIEYFLGKSKYGYISRLLPECSKVENLFNKVNYKYWVDDLKFLKEYVEIKYIGTLLEKNNIIKMINSYDLQIEINQIKKAIEENQKKVNEIILNNFNEIEFSSKKRKISEREYVKYLNIFSPESADKIEVDWEYFEEIMQLKCKLIK